MKSRLLDLTSRHRKPEIADGRGVSRRKFSTTTAAAASGFSIVPRHVLGAGQAPPRVNVTRPQGAWQTCDLAFTAPVFESGKLVQPARLTRFHEGVLVQLNEIIHAETTPRGIPEYKTQSSKEPLAVGGHGCPVRFRNVWVRRL